MKTMIVVLAAVCASVLPAPAFAGGGNANAAWWLLGGAVLGSAIHAHAHRPVPLPMYGGYQRQPQPQIIVVERQSQVVVVRDQTPPPTVVVADPKTPGTACRSNTSGWTGVWILRNDGTKACKAF